MNDEVSGKRVALFPASFDPLTNGHMDLIDRAVKLFDELVVALAVNVSKTGTFSEEERMEMLEAVLGDYEGVRIERFEGLVVDYARDIGACAIIRGLRAMSDFEYEFEMALMNRHLEPMVDILFLAASQEYLYVSSSRLKELVRFGASVADFVPQPVEARLKAKLGSG
ncbi:MAG: pantetheine-phosphate adenylyltransferase [Deltaproteobacteria bacterium]|nr:pantetheine-phosphate adenylyltransferase [Deltaproteobacteria bacterium]